MAGETGESKFVTDQSAAVSFQDTMFSGLQLTWTEVQAFDL